MVNQITSGRRKRRGGLPLGGPLLALPLLTLLGNCAGCSSDADLGASNPRSGSRDTVTAVKSNITRNGDEPVVNAPGMKGSLASFAGRGNINVAGDFIVLNGENGEQVKARPKIATHVEKVKTQSGKNVTYAIHVMEQAFRWKVGATNEIADAENKPRFSPTEYAASLFERAPSDYSRPLIVIGLASHEFEAGHGQAWEEDRAGQRAENLAIACRDVFHKSPIFTLNLGIHQPTGNNPNESAVERRVVVVEVSSEHPLNKEEINEGLQKALRNCEQRGEFKFGLSDYSLWPEATVKSN